MKRARKTEQLEDMINIGPAMAGWLRQAGIHRPDDVRDLGAVECYLRISTVHRNAANRMALYALYGAIHNENCTWLAPDIKEMLEGMLQEAGK
ncbi:MAG: TfoX/Sxy family DNA transformation protein [Alphaproteobacteria bacterium]